MQAQRNILSAGCVWAMGLGLFGGLVGCDDSDPPRSATSNTGVPNPAWRNVVINELSPANTRVIEDELGESPDWVELYNRGSEPINLKGFSLSDSPTMPDKWTFGDVTISPGQYLVVFASGRDINRLDRSPPEDWSGLTEYIWAWADNKNDPPGLSRIDPGQFGSKLVGTANGKSAISANLYLGDNSKTLQWSSALIHQGFSGWDATNSVDFSAYNLAFIEVTLAAGDTINVALCQVGVDCWAGYSVLVVGTGEPNHRYPIPILKAEGLDRSVLTAFEVSAVSMGKITPVLLTDFVFTHTGYFLHTNFKLSSTGEAVVLSDPNRNVLDRAIYPELPRDTSYGRRPNADTDAGAPWFIYAKPTPGSANIGESFDGVCPQPRWSLAPGFYTGSQTASATPSSPCEIYYTLDGSVPTRESTRYTGPFAVAQTTVVRSVTAAEGLLTSEPLTHSYFIDDAHDLPVVSLVTEPGLLFDPVIGIYEMGPAASTVSPYKGANFWQDTEIPANVEFYEPGGALGFETGVGVRIFGNYSRANDMKSLELHFRGEYGLSQLDYSIFPDFPNIRPLNQLVLRNSGGDFGHTMFRDAFESSLTEGMGIDYQKYRPSIVYINGQYWGIHNLREKGNADFVTINHGLQPDTFDLLIPGETAVSGTNNAWKAFTAQLEANGANTPEKYATVASQIDVDNFIDYNCSEIYFNNTDWPGNNVKWYKEHSSTGRWRWIFYDLDAGFGDINKDLLVQATAINTNWPNPTWSTLLLRKLLENPDFKARFVSRCALTVGSYFEPTRVVAHVDSMAARIAPEIPRFFQRWKRDPAVWTSNVDWLRSFARGRPTVMLKQFATFFGLTGTAQFTLQTNGGRIVVDGVTAPSGAFTYPAFLSSPINLQAKPDAGRSFSGWSDGVSTAERTVTLTNALQLAANFN